MKRFTFFLVAFMALLVMSCNFLAAPGGAPVASSIAFREADGTQALVTVGTAVFTADGFSAPNENGIVDVTFAVESGPSRYKIMTTVSGSTILKPFAARLPIEIYRQVLSPNRPALVFERIENSDLWQCGGFALNSNRPFATYKVADGKVMVFMQLTFDGGGYYDMYLKTDHAMLSAILKAQG